MRTISPSPTNQLVGGRYRLGSLIAVGGMSAVYRAWDLVLQRAVAVKLYAPNPDRTAQRRFDEEARTLASLSHPGLVAVYDAGTTFVPVSEIEQPYLVMQLIDGPTLREHLAEHGPLDPDEVRRLGAQLARTLEYVHSRGVIHRDVKPSNILLDAGLTPYLADFGISRLVDSARVTAAGKFVGTAGYLAPEQVRGDGGGPVLDVYALGLVLLECLTGQVEYAGSDVEAAVARLSRPPRIPDDVPDGLAVLITAMTTADPDLRPTAAQCAAALSGPCTARGVALVKGRIGAPPSLGTRLMSRRLRERGALATAAVVTALAAAIGWNQFGDAMLTGGAPSDGTRPAAGSAPAPALVGTVLVRLPTKPSAAPAPPPAAPAPAVAAPAPARAPVAQRPAAGDDARAGRGGDRADNGKGKAKKPQRG